MLIDTNIIIACLNAESNIVRMLSEWKEERRSLFISSITIAETLSLSKLQPSKIVKIKAFLENFISIPFDNNIAELAASLRRSYGLKLPDAGIAATALFSDFPLVTRDRQFRRIEELTIVEI